MWNRPGGNGGGGDANGDASGGGDAASGGDGESTPGGKADELGDGSGGGGGGSGDGDSNGVGGGSGGTGGFAGPVKAAQLLFSSAGAAAVFTAISEYVTCSCGGWVLLVRMLWLLNFS